MNTTMIEGDREPITTGGTIAMVNLTAQIDGLTAQGRSNSAGQPITAFAIAQQAVLAELLTMRGHLLGRVADYEQASRLAEQLVRDAPKDGVALLARARTRATLHRFSAALADLDAAGRAGTTRAVLDAERATILQAVGCYDEAEALYEKTSVYRAEFTHTCTLAVLRAEQGRIAEAEALFSEARSSYRGVSPFSLAQLDFRRGLMWMREGELLEADRWFDAARRRLPGYVPAVGHQAEVLLMRGEPETAVDRLRPLAENSDDPEYAAQLSLALDWVGHDQEALVWREYAAARYDELMLHHPEAYADHAAEFWLDVGADADKAYELALRALVMHQTRRSHALLQRTARARGGCPVMQHN